MRLGSPTCTSEMCVHVGRREWKGLWAGGTGPREREGHKRVRESVVRQTGGFFQGSTMERAQGEERELKDSRDLQSDACKESWGIHHQY